MSSAVAKSTSHLHLVASRDGPLQLARRLAAIDTYRILDSPREQDFDDIASLAATLCDAPFAAISFVTEHRQWFKAEVGLCVRQTPIGQSFCAHAIRQDDIFVVPDASVHPMFVDNDLVTGPPHIRFYAGMPLYASDGTPIAALCVLDTVARPGGLTDRQRKTLRVLARQVETRLELRRSLFERDRQAAEQQSMAERLRWMADHDVLTALPNRALFHARLDDAIETARDRGTSVALLVLDVDHFKQINEASGHDGGDAVLCAVADRLSECSRPGDTVARLGGDEFAVVMPGLGEGIALDLQVTRLLRRLREPIGDEARAFDCRVSIGVAIGPGDADAIDTLCKCADLALAAAKVAGRDRAIHFDPSMLADLKQEQRVLAQAREAIARDEIVPYYQPKVDLRQRKVVGFEALLRWEMPGATLLPSVIERAFADHELSRAISGRMLERVLRDMRGWLDAGVAFGHVAINSCAVDFARNDFAEHILGELAAAGVPPAMFQVEVTESVFLGRGSFHVARALAVLSRAGVRIALDDFGTGFASLTHLKRFTIDVLKIDRSFVAGIDCNPDDTAIVRTVIGLGHGLGIETVAEGIETEPQADFVRDCGCVLGQGFLFGAAQPASAVAAQVRRIN